MMEKFLTCLPYGGDHIHLPETDKYNQSDEQSHHRYAATNLTNIIQYYVRFSVRDILLMKIGPHGK